MEVLHDFKIMPLPGTRKYMLKINCIYFILVIPLANMLSNCSPVAKPVQIEKTYNQQQYWSLNYLNENVLSCQRIQDSVAFRTTAKIGVGIWSKSWNQDFILGREGEFFLSPDHHLKASFRIESIDSAGMRIRYEYQFDHRSFGKDLISIDSGEIQFNYK